jgi:hypothetical protein
MRDFIDETFEAYTNPRFVLWVVVAVLIIVNIVVYTE